MPLIVGTSGWQYRHWREVLYPADVPQRRWLEHYAEHYATVENDGTFYRLPARDTFADWQARTPPGFVMAIKASRYLTHVKRLKDPAEPVARLLAAAAGLGEKLGPVLVQLPPNLHADLDKLDTCLAAFTAATEPAGLTGPVKIAVEPRHQSWWTDDTKRVLAAHGAALCLSDRRGRPVSPLWRTTDWGYLRLHEGAASPWPRYGTQALRRWIDDLTRMWPDDSARDHGAAIYVYFNNDQLGAAVADAAAFADLARQAGRAVTRTAQC
jgi:uncharacterized protein YecE (DUF72 family)